MIILKKKLEEIKLLLIRYIECLNEFIPIGDKINNYYINDCLTKALNELQLCDYNNNYYFLSHDELKKECLNLIESIRKNKGITILCDDNEYIFIYLLSEINRHVLERHKNYKKKNNKIELINIEDIYGVLIDKITEDIKRRVEITLKNLYSDVLSSYCNCDGESDEYHTCSNKKSCSGYDGCIIKNCFSDENKKFMDLCLSLNPNSEYCSSELQSIQSLINRDGFYECTCKCIDLLELKLDKEFEKIIYSKDLCTYLISSISGQKFTEQNLARNFRKNVEDSKNSALILSLYNVNKIVTNNICMDNVEYKISVPEQNYINKNSCNLHDKINKENKIKFIKVDEFLTEIKNIREEK